MVVTDDHAYPHLCRTGGVFTTGVIQAFFSFKDAGPFHAPASVCSDRTKTFFGTSSNPWRWYRSVYCYANGANENPNKPALSGYGNGDGHWKSWLYGVTHPSEVKEIPDCIGVIYYPMGDPKRLKTAMVNSGLGLCSFLNWFTYGGPQGVDYIVPTDQLYEGLTEILNRPVTRERFPPKNGTADRNRYPPGLGDDLEEWYDEESADWVVEADSMLIDLGGWIGITGCAEYPVIDVRHHPIRFHDVYEWTR